MSKIYEPKGRAREYSPFALNYFTGCDHGCQYCYVPRIMKTFNSAYIHENVSCNIEGIEKEAERFSKSKNHDKQILLSFTGDPYCGFESGETSYVLKALLAADCHVSVLTKNPHKAMKDIAIMKEFEHFKIGTTLTCLYNSDSLKWEPDAPLGGHRIKALKDLADQGIKTWASFEPVIYPFQTIDMIKAVSGFIDHVKIGKMNNNPIAECIDWKAFLHEAVTLCRSLGMKFYIKNDLAAFDPGFEFRPDERDQDLLNV